jgi:hypothetical protein
MTAKEAFRRAYALYRSYRQYWNEPDPDMAIMRHRCIVCADVVRALIAARYDSEAFWQVARET